MSFYASLPDWICPNCQTSNPHRYLKCYRCFTERPEEEKFARPSKPNCGYCHDEEGDNLRCPYHGVIESNYR